MEQKDQPNRKNQRIDLKDLYEGIVSVLFITVHPSYPVGGPFLFI